jgi:hypothetical protein
MGGDNHANNDFYGKSVGATQIVRDGAVPVLRAGKSLVSLLDKLTPKRM